MSDVFPCLPRFSQVFKLRCEVFTPGLELFAAGHLLLTEPRLQRIMNDIAIYDEYNI